MWWTGPEQSAQQANNIPMPPMLAAFDQSVDFSYSSDSPQILHNVSLEVPRTPLSVGNSDRQINGSEAAAALL